MASSSIQLLLLESIESLGIVGDIVKVKRGYARNYLLPMGLAEPPTPSKIESLRQAREEALASMNALRQAREELLGRMEEVAIEMTRSCNDQGVLYGSVTQRDIAEVLQGDGYDVGIRSVRLPSSIRRIGEHHVSIQFDKDLRTEVTVNILPDEPFEEAVEEEKQDKQKEQRDDRPMFPGEREAAEAAAEY
ncbi:MAG: 50S ribosomal protein L9 [Planctomycetota bacterium]|jgi:large subunit ribosomal protein L9